MSEASEPIQGRESQTPFQARTLSIFFRISCPSGALGESADYFLAEGKSKTNREAFCKAQCRRLGPRTAGTHSVASQNTCSAMESKHWWLFSLNSPSVDRNQTSVASPLPALSAPLPLLPTSFHHQQALAHRQSLWSVASPSFCMDLAGPKGV
jgi:hypothetical protein